MGVHPALALGLLAAVAIIGLPVLAALLYALVQIALLALPGNFQQRFVARRYLFSRGKRALLSAITMIAVSGVAVGVASLVIVIGVMDGAEEELFGKIIDLNPHMRVTHAWEDELADPAEALEITRSTPGVTLAWPAVSKEVLLSVGRGSLIELVAGQIVSFENPADNPLHTLRRVSGVEPAELGEHEVILGDALAEKIEAKEGDLLLVITGLSSENTNRQKPAVQLRVAGIFKTGYFAFDSVSAIITGATARGDFAQGDAIDYIHVKVEDPQKAVRIATGLERSLGPGYAVTPWQTEHQGFFNSLVVQKFGLYLILMLIIVVAGFNIIGTLILMVIEKTRQIGIMKATGTAPSAILRIFLHTGAVIGLLGTAAGTAIGLFGAFLIRNVIRIDMEASIYNMERLPVKIVPATVAIIVLSVMAICLLASLFPALQAARLRPVDALRDE